MDFLGAFPEGPIPKGAGSSSRGLQNTGKWEKLGKKVGKWEKREKLEQDRKINDK